MIEFKEPFLRPGEKLICFGDSLTAQGVYIDELQKCLPENTIINAGRGGDKTPWALTRFQTDVIDAKPDAVLLFFGTNDAAIGRGCWADEPLVPPEVYCWNLIWMVHLAKLAGIQNFTIAAPVGSFEGDSYLEQGDIMRDYCLKAREAASYSKCRLIPLDVFFHENRKPVPMTELVMTRDGCHPTDETYRAMAHFMLKAWNLSKEA